MLLVLLSKDRSKLVSEVVIQNHEESSCRSCEGMFGVPMKCKNIHMYIFRSCSCFGRVKAIASVLLYV